ncbi:MAG: fatty acyl-AMP ligase, partial [Planctomycetota bacterium]
MPRLASITRNCKAVAALTERNTLETMDRSAEELQNLRWVTVDDIDVAKAESVQPLELSRDRLAFLQYTSGSTSDPKGVMVSHGNLLHNLEMIRQGFGLRSVAEGGDLQTGVFWLPAYHDMGLIGGILESLYVGGHSVLMSPASFLQRPIGWLETMSRFSATISGAPNFAYELAVNRSTDEQRRDLDLSNWRVAFCGAEPIRPATLQQFSEAFAVSGFRHDSFYPCYGLAESTLLASGGIGPAELTLRRVDREALGENRVATTTDDNGQVLVGCGDAIHNQEIAIVDPTTCERCPDDVIGEVWVKGESIAQGYWGLEEESETTFRAKIAGTDDGPFLRTGDLGFKLDGHLFVTGRVKDVIIIRGRNHYPQDIERSAADSHEALRLDSGAVFTIDSESGQEQLVVVQEVDRQYRNADFDEVIRQVRRSVSESHELEVYRVVLIRHANLPRTTSGKVQRNLCRQQLAAGELKVLADWERQKVEDAPAKSTGESTERFKRQDGPMSPDEVDRLSERVESWLLSWLVDRAAIPEGEVHRDKPFAEYGLDSLT